ncbi:molybdate ABC transporter substrate-binding protein [Pusillimonas sp. CC-YST705]|uniref:Molybdate ABC transporter substrate-binding protein n=1 Tax=Mesopusillimonas faecipullorum TaxID=2755040 RepID=A0ABS8CCU3_9BURK|nr:molybdate ABC transporter substrate-binding protein [Mesopusillimonas faecipullorum]MCB5363861.1 molybdate ABC transporter substrate-binding protein [Mesopusillimonas faecipullorum]
MQKRKLLIGLALGLASASLSAQTLIVSAAASLTNAFKEINTQFEKAHPGVNIEMTTGASGSLLQQIQQGAPADLFASADQTTMDRAASQNLIDPATRTDFVTNSLVLIVPSQSESKVESVDALKDASIQRIAIGKTDTVPVGRYTKQALEASGDWETLSPKYIPSDNVRQVLDYVARGEVDAGFVYRTDAALMADKVKVVATPKTHAPITYPIAVIAATKEPAVAKQYIQYLSSDAAREALARYGFGKP